MESGEIERWLEAACCDDGFDPAAHGSLDEEEDESPPGPPLRDDELNGAHSTLAVPRSPRDFQAVVKGLHRRTTSKVLFNNPRQKFLLDAWTLAELAIRFGSVEEVRLAGLQERWPDGYVRVGGLIKSVEATIADMPGRKMGKEYRSNNGIEPDPVEDWISRANAVPQASVVRTAPPHSTSGGTLRCSSP
jgi:hypothetical protein